MIPVPGADSREYSGYVVWHCFAVGCSLERNGVGPGHALGIGRAFCVMLVLPGGLKYLLFFREHRKMPATMCV